MVSRRRNQPSFGEIKMTIETKIIADSIGEHSPRLTTFLSRYPKFIHGEHLRHRSASFCVSSSRAVPVSKNLEEVKSDELRASPVWWGKEQKGMSAAEELDDTDTCVRWPDDLPRLLVSLAYMLAVDMRPALVTEREYVKRLWQLGAIVEAEVGEDMSAHGAHKSVVNRRLESDLHVNVLWTICKPGLMNFFGLRLDKAAQPEMRVLAEATWRAWNESKPQVLRPGWWHLPFIDEKTGNQIFHYVEQNSLIQDVAIRISVARCARLSYTSFETGKRSTIEEDLRLYDRLITARPIHASPAEHQATPDVRFTRYVDRTNDREIGSHVYEDWRCPHLHGNLHGWHQYRKQLPSEAIAELPKEYRKEEHNAQ